jgi:membrane-bound ClpP family serine protease
VAAARAQAPVPEDGLFISVRNPITSDVKNRVIDRTKAALRRTDSRIRTIVYDFNPDGQPSGSSDYGTCLDLAQFLLELHDVTAVAFVRQEVTRHTVLPVLACHKIVMASGAKLGDVTRDSETVPKKHQRDFYEHVARTRNRSPALVLKMLDRNLVVLEGRTRTGVVGFIDQALQAEEARAGFRVTNPEPVLRQGEIGLYTAAEARDKYQLCTLIRESKQEVAEAYQMSPASLREEPSEFRSPVRILVKGAVTRALAERVQRQIRREIGKRSNFLILQLECLGEDTQTARDLADFLRNLKDDTGSEPVKTVAYVPERAPAAATFVALGCSEIVMGKNAELGDFETVLSQGQGEAKREAHPGSYKFKVESLMDLAEKQGYNPLLVRGMMDRAVGIYRVHSQKGAAEWRLITADEYRADQVGEQKWGKATLIKKGDPDGKLLKLNATLAKDLGVARHVVDSEEQLYALYLDGVTVRDADSDWLDALATFLRNPRVSILLVMIGIVCLILELKIPGASIPGVLAALCFVLYFWAHAPQISGQVLWLGVLLFLLGLVLIGLEIFVLPGFGFTGISGIILIVGSLALVTLERMPQTTQEWLSFGTTLSYLAFGLVAGVLGALLLGAYLHQIPFVNRLVLNPEADKGEGGEGSPSGGLFEEAPAPAAVLLGAIGTAATPLRPAGKARFGEDFLDVVAEGSYVQPGSRVQVIEIEGNRIVVKEV